VEILGKLDDTSKTKLKIISNKVISTYKSLLPDTKLKQYLDDIKKIKILLTFITQTKPIDITSLKKEIDKIIEQSIKSDSFLIQEYHLSKNILDLTNQKFEKDFYNTVDEVNQLPEKEKKLQLISLQKYLEERLKSLA
jgi:hypothetical protein